jgi:transcriptional regulator with XRE-family HTH domain
MDDWRAIVGSNVRRLRKAAGLTQEQLAFEAKIDLTYVGGIERGRRNPSVLVLGRIAHILNAEPADLLKRRND